MLSIVALLSVIWLAARNWYGWYQLEPRSNAIPQRRGSANVNSVDEDLNSQDLLEESATYNQLNPATLTAEEIAQRLREEGSRSD
jgi:hypothetical protein